MAGQRLIFCVGAAKSGTSWLWDYLHGHPDCHLPALKELHYFDVIEAGKRPFFRKDLNRLIERLEAEAAAGTLGAFNAARLADARAWREAFDGETRDDAAYLDYLGLGRVSAPLVGDFTPSYALLSEATYADMARVAEDVRFVFLMRDPVARLWSNVRMDAGAGASEAKLDGLLVKVLDGQERNIADRSNYRRTLNRLFKAVPRERLFVEFYEHLFRPETIDRLTDFLGISRHPAQFEKVVHGGRPASVPAARIGQMRDYLRPQYNFVARLMGELPTEWLQTMRTA